MLLKGVAAKLWLEKNEDGGTVECDSTYARKRCV